MESSGDGRSQHLSDFSRVLDSGTEMALDEAMLLISGVISGRCDIIENLVRIDELASDVASPTVEGIARHLFAGDRSFSGNARNYYDPRNSLLDHVLERRLGIPITLSVLMIAVGRRLGVSLCGVGMPGHFLVGTHAEVGEVPRTFIDPFNGGTIMDLDGCRSLFARMTGTASGFDRRFLACLHPIAILDRATSNLKAIFESSDRLDSLRWVMATRSRLPGLGKLERDEFLRLMAPLN